MARRLTFAIMGEDTQKRDWTWRDLSDHASLPEDNNRFSLSAFSDELFRVWMRVDLRALLLDWLKYSSAPQGVDL